MDQPKPRIDYTLKAVGGSLTAIPGIADMIDVSFNISMYSICFIIEVCCYFIIIEYIYQDTVNTIITDMLQWPHRIVVPIGGIPVDTR